MRAGDAAVQMEAGAVRISIRLTPNGGRDALEGLESGADGRAYMKARVTAVPEKGKANKALVTLLARQAGVAKSAVSLISGETQRLKILRIEGDPEEILSRLGFDRPPDGTR